MLALEIEAMGRIVRSHRRNREPHVNNAHAAAPERKRSKMAKTPRNPVKRESIRNHPEIKGKHTVSGFTWNRTDDRVQSAQCNGPSGQDRAALQDERHNIRSQFSVARQNARSNQLEALIGKLRHVGGDRLREGNDAKYLHPKMAGYIDEQCKGRDPAEDLTGCQSSEREENIAIFIAAREVAGAKFHPDTQSSNML